MASRGLFTAVCVVLLLSPAGGLHLRAAPPGVPPRGAVAAQTAFATAPGARLRSPRHDAWCAARRPCAAVLNMSGKDGMEKFIDRMLDKLEAKSKKKWDKVCAKTERFQARFARLMGSSSSIQPTEDVSLAGKVGGGRQRLQRVWALATKSPTSMVLSLAIFLCALPGLSMAFGAAIGVVLFALALGQMFLVTLAPAGMLLLAGGILWQPVLVNVASSSVALLTLVAAVMLRTFPRMRGAAGLSIGTALPLANLWLASIPVHSFEVVKSMRVFDPLAAILTDPFFRPVLPDMFFSDFLDLIPDPFLLRGPTVFIESSAPGPLLGLKAAISIGALLVAAYYWYQERGAVAGQLQRFLATDKSAELKSASVDTSRDLDGMREEMGKEGLKLWESAYKLRPATSPQKSSK